jgi:hypothetical protein
MFIAVRQRLNDGVAQGEPIKHEIRPPARLGGAQHAGGAVNEVVRRVGQRHADALQWHALVLPSQKIVVAENDVYLHECEKVFTRFFQPHSFISPCIPA